MATVECKWLEERVDGLKMLFEERLCLYNTKLKENMQRFALDDAVVVLGIIVA